MHSTFEEALKKANLPNGREKQNQVFDSFRSGKHVILKAPTGWGKTFAVNAAIGEGHYIYSLPLRVLVDSLVEATNDFKLYECIAHHGQERNHPFLDPGDNPEKTYKLVYTTLDQTLSAFLGIPIGVSIRQGNILPAVIDNSHLIFDEFHLFDPERSWTTALFALENSKQNGIILTATLSDYMLSFLEDFLSTRTEVGKEFGVDVIVANRPFVNLKKLIQGSGFDDVSTLEIENRTIIIRNDIASAKDTAEKLRNSKSINQPVYLLHSELLTEDRKKIEDDVREIFKEKSEKSGILVATQVVEAGIDITCDIMHTDLCPPPSFIQRAGRNARYQSEKKGKIIWHPIENLGPYRDQEELIHELSIFLKNKRVLTEEVEQEIINLSESFDRQQVENFKLRNFREVNRIRANRDYSAYKDMIRSIDNKNIAIGNDLGESYNFISVAKSKFYNENSFFYQAVYNKPSKFGIYDSESKDVIQTNNFEKADFILLNPEYIGYKSDYGFTFDEIQGAKKFINDRVKFYSKYEYEDESYEDHINRLYQKRSTISWIINQLAKHPLIGRIDNADFITRFLIWAHDLGKLNIEWQKCHNIDPNDIPLAHSDDDGPHKRIRKPPKHAWVSAWVISNYIREVLGDELLVKGVFWAIADHHGYSDNLSIKDLKPYKIAFIDYLRDMGKNNNWIEKDWVEAITKNKQCKNSDLENIIRNFNSIKLNNDDDLSLYYSFCYILRKCDQKATEIVSKKVIKEVCNKNSSNGIFL